MSLEEQVRETIQRERKVANDMIDSGPKDDTLALSLMINGLSNGLEKALALIAARVDTAEHQ